MRGGREHCDSERVQVNYHAISAAFILTHKPTNTVCVPALYWADYVNVCACS